MRGGGGGRGGWRINEEARGTDVQLRSGSKSFSSTFPAGIVFSDHIYILLVKFARGSVRSVYITREILLTPLKFPHRRCCALSIDSAPRHFLETSVYVFHSRALYPGRIRNKQYFLYGDKYNFLFFSFLNRKERRTERKEKKRKDVTRLSCYAESRFEMKVYVHFEIIFGNREIRISADKNENCVRIIHAQTWDKNSIRGLCWI